jgi:hypothetical protein
MSRVLFIAPVYEYEPILVPSLRLQGHQDWQLLLIHDGPNRQGLAERLRQLADPRIAYFETVKRYNDWGHSLRALALERVAAEPIVGDFVVITNGDNYYCPGFVEQMLAGFTDDTIATYCRMSHNHRNWNLIDTRLEHQFIDCGCVMVRRSAVLEVGWRSREHAADWVYVADLLHSFGAEQFRKVSQVLFVHN